MSWKFVFNGEKRLNVEDVSRYTTGRLQAPTSKALAVGRGS